MPMAWKDAQECSHVQQPMNNKERCCKAKAPKHRETASHQHCSTARPKRLHRRMPLTGIFEYAPDKDEPADRIRGSLGRHSFSDLRHNVQGERQTTALLHKPKRANVPRRWMSARPKGYATGLQRRGDVLWCPWPGRMHRNAATCNTDEQQRALLHSKHPSTECAQGIAIAQRRDRSARTDGCDRPKPLQTRLTKTNPTTEFAGALADAHSAA